MVTVDIKVKGRVGVELCSYSAEQIVVNFWILIIIK